MLRSTRELEHYAIGASDGPIGEVQDLYFDDDRWAVRYLVVETGSWLSSRRVLISPLAIRAPRWPERELPVALTREQVRNSPDIDTHKPVSRQHEIDYLGYYGYPYYWGGTGLWGNDLYPYPMAYGSDDDVDAERLREAKAYVAAEGSRQHRHDAHLRSCQAVIGYHVRATDGDIGHIDEVLLDDQTWAIRYLVVNTSNWWLGHRVLVAPQWVTALHWADRSVNIDLTRTAIRDAPAFTSTATLNRDQENGLYGHYGRPGYWGS